MKLKKEKIINLIGFRHTGALTYEEAIKLDSTLVDLINPSYDTIVFEDGLINIATDLENIDKSLDC